MGLQDALLTMCTTLLRKKQKGRLVVLSYHSIEDRIVKRIMKYGTIDTNEIYYNNNKRDIYGNVVIDRTKKKKPYKMIGKFYIPTKEEIDMNVRARSAILRIA